MLPEFDQLVRPPVTRSLLFCETAMSVMSIASKPLDRKASRGVLPGTCDEQVLAVRGKVILWMAKPEVLMRNFCGKV